MVCLANDIDVPWSAREVLKDLKNGAGTADRPGMNELNQRIQNAEARATAAEGQAQATQQELPRSQAGVKGKGKSAAVLQQQEQEIAFASKCQPQPLEGADDKWRDWARVFRSWSGRFFGGPLTKFNGHVEGHVTIQHTSWTWRSRH